MDRQTSPATAALTAQMTISATAADGQPRRLRRAVRGLAAGVSIVVAVTLLGQGAAYGRPWAGDWQPPAPQQIQGVPVGDAPPPAPLPEPVWPGKVDGPREVVWPQPATHTVTLPSASTLDAVGSGSDDMSWAGSAGTVVVPDSPIRISAPSRGGPAAAQAAKPEDDPSAVSPSAPVAAVTVSVAGRQAAAQAGVQGVLLQISAATTGAGDLNRRHLAGLGEQAPVDAQVNVEVDYSGFAHAYGGDWASRLRIVALDGCGLSADAVTGSCQIARPLPTTNDPDAQTVTATAPLSTGGGVTMLAVTGAPAGDNGDFTATSLSSAGTWQVSAQTGGFSWSLPLRMPPGVNGPVPSLALSYSSQAVDGRTGNTNNQGSWIGDGWEMWPGYIERQYQTCASDMDDVGGQTPNNSYATGDQCWLSDNATVSLNGTATELIKVSDDDSTSVWKGVADDGSRVERFKDTSLGSGDADGEYWKVTTTDGTQYFFGRHLRPGFPADTAATDSVWTTPVYGNHPGEPCHVTADFSGSRCVQAWRWNLDYVVDVHGNTMTLFYGQETGAYGREGDPDLRTEYVRGGYLTKIEYGTRQGSEHTATIPARVMFDVADRCTTGTSCDFEPATDFPDTPVDQYCAAAPCLDQGSPTFWTQKRLDKIRTQLWRGSSFSDVESWQLRHDYLDPGASDGQGEPMWLSGVTHRGHVTTAGGQEVTDPEIVFHPTTNGLANRVDDPNVSRSELRRFRMQRIVTETGSVVLVSYTPQECTWNSLPVPETNGKRCFPQWYGPNGQEPTLDWFHKYLVDSVSVQDQTMASVPVETHYDYLDTPAWHYDDSELVDPDKRTWSQYRGYSKVRVRTGAEGGPQTAVEYLYLRGMHGDRATPTGGTKTVQIVDSQGVAIDDHEAHAGFPRETITYNGAGGPIISKTISDPWRHQSAVSGDGLLTGWLTGAAATTTFTMLESGGPRVTKTATAFDTTYGMPTQIDDLGVVGDGGDDRCVRHTYARSTSAWIVDKVARSETVKVNCATTPARPGDVIADTRTFFDDPDTFGTPPTRGLVVRSQELDSWNGATPVYATTSTASHDVHGRITATFDALGRQTSYGYTPATGGPVTAIATTNAAGQTTSATLEPAWGATLSATDANGRRGEMTYDGSGRLLQVWQAGRDKATQTPNHKFAYQVSNESPSWVKTETLLNVGDDYVTSITVYDGQLRARQTQTSATGGGRTIVDTGFDSRGLAVWQSAPYWDSTGTPPQTTLAAMPLVFPAKTDTVYDGAGRVVEQIIYAGDEVTGYTEKWKTITAYGGDRVHVTPPAGGTATTTISNARGLTTELREYHGPAPSGSFDATVYAHTPRGQLASVTDPAGNVWSWQYDLRGRQTTAVDPDAGTSTSVYDAAGQLTQTTDGRGISLGYTYDQLGRKTSIRDGSPAGPKRAEWTYDTLPGGIGQLSRSIRYDSGLAYTTEVLGYDAAGRPTGSRVIIPSAETNLAGTYETEVGFWQDGSLGGVTLPAVGGLPLEAIAYAYNDVGDQDEIVSSETLYIYGSTFNVFGQLTQRIIGHYNNRTTINYSYDEPTRRLTNTLVVKHGPAEVADLAYKWDNAGNLTRIADSPGATLPTDTECFRYDYKRRLTHAWTPANPMANNCDQPPGITGGPAKYRHEYTYDVVGNRTQLKNYSTSTSFTTTSYTHPAPGSAQPHTVTSATTTPGSTSTYQYDAGGNTIARVVGGNTQTLTWTPEGQIESTADTTGTVTYVYDADGNRLIRRDPAGKTLYLPGQELRHSFSGGIQTCTRYYTHLGQTVAIRVTDSQVPEGKVYWAVTDHQGTTDILIRDSDAAHQRRRTSAFGQTRGPAPTWWAGDKGFLDGTNDPNTLTHLGARLYDPTLGRFTSVDPIMNLANPQQMHGYAYSNNNPATWSDPSGLYFIDGNGGTDELLRAHRVTDGEGGYKTKFTANSETFDSLTRAFERWGGEPPTFLEFVNDNRNTHITNITDDDAGNLYWYYDCIYIAQQCADYDDAYWTLYFTINQAQWEGLLGITDAKDCAAGNSIAACGWTALNALGPIGKLGALAKLGKLAAVENLVEKATSAAKPAIKPGSAGGPTAGKAFPKEIRDKALAENPNTCVYCGMTTTNPHVDHAIPKSRGGNATIDNAQTACPHCNMSKGARDYPVTPPPGYEGPWPPQAWGAGVS